MTPVPDPQGWGRTDGLLIKQPVRAEARRLFIGSGSLTWFRRPRLASPESTTEVEAIHPRVKFQPLDPTGPFPPTFTRPSMSEGRTAPMVRPSSTTTITCFPLI